MCGCCEGRLWGPLRGLHDFNKPFELIISNK